MSFMENYMNSVVNRQCDLLRTKNMDKTLVLVPNANMYFFPYIVDENIDVASVCRPLGKVENNMMRVIRRLDMPYPMFFGEWKKSLNKYSNVILFDMSFTPALANYIKMHSNATVYVYLWNPIKSNNKMLRYVRMAQKSVEVFSYDKDDCDKYHMSFAPMMYSSNLNVEKADVIYDLAFLGYAKDRMSQLKHYYNIFTKANLKCNFYVVGDSQESQDGFTISKSGLSYQEYLKMIASSKAILDLVQSGQSGLSLRVLESVFLRKKLVTGNTRVKEYDLYRPENIYILQNNNIDGLLDFFQTPYVDLEESVVKKYDFKNWIDHYIMR